MGHQEDIVKTESKIIIIRDTQVILDRDVAELYGVETREINQALRNNPKKFPPGYVIELNNREKDELIKNFGMMQFYQEYNKELTWVKCIIMQLRNHRLRNWKVVIKNYLSSIYLGLTTSSLSNE